MRHPEYSWSLEETWLFEAILECYLPLLEVLTSLARQGVNPHPALVVSPTLLAMLGDDFMLARFDQYLEQLLDFCHRLARHYAKDGARSALVEFYRERFRRLRKTFFVDWGGDLPRAWSDLERHGRLELLTTALTHAYLPLLESFPGCARLQIEGGLLMHQAVFGRRPAGFWLPECGFTPRLGRLLKQAGAEYTIVEGHGLLLGRPRPPYGVFAPVRCPDGLAVFAREPTVSLEIWSRRSGYPTHPLYREFFRDLAGEVEPELRGGFALPAGAFRPSGVKIYAVGGEGAQKPFYRPQQALRQARVHARKFVENRRRQFRRLRLYLPSPLVLAPYDAELFGHWWYEGPQFLEEVWRRSAGQRDFLLESPGSFLSRIGEAYVSCPEVSSWGAGGYHQVWLSRSNDWILPMVERAWRALLIARRKQPQAHRQLRQALRELLLAQSSDWPFMIFWDRQAQYAEGRLRDHLSAAEKLLQGRTGDDFLEERARRWPFPPDWLADRLLDLLADETG